MKLDQFRGAVNTTALFYLLMRVFLVGLPGVGKSTLGPLLAKALGIIFSDLDLLISLRYGQTPAKQLQTAGAGVFRWREAAELRRWIARSPNGILACGGGTPVYFDGMQLICTSGLAVWLDIDEASWLERIRFLNDRPFFFNVNGQFEPEWAIQLRNQREPVYRQAHMRLVVPDDPISPEWISSSAQKVQRATNQV